jgi:TolB-like protein/thioredoxin-like negative regulator of GroEL
VVTSWLVLQVADVVLNNFTAPDWIFHVLTLALAIGFPLALIFAWVFEVTPEGVKRDSEVDLPQTYVTQSNRKLDFMIIGVLIVALSYFAYDKWFDEEPIRTPPDQNSIVVLPFVNMSGDLDNEHVSDGLTEILLNRLAQSGGLRVINRTSAFAFKGQEMNVGEIAAFLGVAYVLEGSYLQAGTDARVTVRLIRADDLFPVWAENYGFPQIDTFAIQDKIADAVAGVLGVLLSPQGIATTNIDALDKYFRALEKNAENTYTSLPEAEILLQAALTVDPNFFEARIALARNYLKQMQTGIIGSEEGNSKIRVIAAQLLAKRPNNAVAKGLDLTMQAEKHKHDGNHTAALALLPEFKRLLKTVPNEFELRVYIARMLTAHDLEQAAALLEGGLPLDPHNTDLLLQLARIYGDMGRLADVEAALYKARELKPNDPMIVGYLGELARAQGRPVEMLNWFRLGTELDPQDHEFLSYIAEALFRLNFVESGNYWAARSRALEPDSAVYRGLELTRAVSVGDEENIKAIAIAIIEDKVEDRGGVPTMARRQYARIMHKQGRAQEALDGLRAIYPELNTPAQETDTRYVILMRLDFLDLWREVLSPDLYRERYDRFMQLSDARGIKWHQNAVMWLSLLDGDNESAITIAREEMNGINVLSDRSVTNEWVYFEEWSLFKPLLDDPEIVNRIEELKLEEARFRADIEAMLQTPEWAIQ